MTIKKLSFYKFLFWLLLGLNGALLFWFIDNTGSAWGWEVTDFTLNFSINLLNGLAVAQFLLFALSLDIALRLAVLLFNHRSHHTQIPAILLQCASIVIYLLVGLLGFILLYDHSVTNILAASSLIGLSIGYVCRDLIADVVNSIVIQADGLISINDWIEVPDGEKTQYFQVVEFDRRMVTLRNRFDYLVRIPNTRFIGMSYINLSKQSAGRGSRRTLKIQLDSLNNSEKVLEVLNLALEALLDQNKHFVDSYFCGVNQLSEGMVTYRIEYECIPSMHVGTSENLVMKAVLRFLTTAGMNTGSSMEIQTLDRHLAKTSNRLYETYEYSILKVLSHQEAMQLSETATIISCYAGEQLICAGDQADSMFLISEGSLEVKIKNDQHQLVTVASLWPGDCVGEMSLLTGAPRSADVFARVDCILVEIKKEHIAPLLESNPRLINEISDLLAKRQAHLAAAAGANANEGLREKSKSIAKKILQFFFRKAT